jgi:hypothetical protein
MECDSAVKMEMKISELRQCDFQDALLSEHSMVQKHICNMTLKN